MAQPKHKTQTDLQRNGTNASLSNDENAERSVPFDIVAAILEDPRPFIASLHEEIDQLVDALIEARLRAESDVGHTRRDIVLDLYDEELISKQHAVTCGELEDSDFFSALIARRQARSRIAVD